MIADESRKKLQDIIRGAILQGQQDHCAKIRNLLSQSFRTGTTVKSEFESRAIIKEEQIVFLKTYAEKVGLWMDSLPPNCEYITHGGESEVYLAPDKLNVIKVNDAIYYATWTEYFNSLVIHNLLFPNTAYLLLGFINSKERFCIVLQQPFIEGEQAELESIQELLTYNDFENIKRQDYYNKEFGLLLEDMHDENVIAKDDVLFFIDTVFYIMENK
ncbi:hypothetical protein ACI6Q2_20450 [Chitinophagaceae bacterium LWZ2-11]